MGRKRRLVATAREKVVAEEAATALEVEQKEAVLQGKPDEALFIVDAAGSGRKRRKYQKEAKAPKYLSKNDKKIVVHKYLGKTGPKPSQSRKRLSDPWADDDSKSENQSEEVQEGLLLTANEEGVQGDAKGLVEAGDGFVAIPRKPTGQSSKRRKPTARDLAKLGVCHPGQSYNPTEDDHDDVLASAVAVELRRQEAVDDEKRPVAVGMSKQTLDLLIGDSEGESSDEEADESGGVSLGRPTPATGKLTRAQRNKQKRVKEAAHQLATRRKKKDMLKSIDKVTNLQKQVAEQERIREERRQTKRLLKAQKSLLEEQGAAGGGLFGPSAGVAAMTTKRQANKDVIAGRSVPVNLGEELHGSLRQLKAQGSVLMDKVELLKASKAHPDQRKGRDRAKKAPKGFRKKHTYKDRYKDE